jgi:hypothetical protein
MSVIPENSDEKLTVFPVSPHYFNCVEFAVEFRIENANMTSHLKVHSDVLAQLGLKAVALAWLSMALAFRICRLGQSCQ